MDSKQHGSQTINLHAVPRRHRAFRGAFRRRAIPVGTTYGGDFEIITDIIFGQDLDPPWQRLVICKEVLHVFDAEPSRVDTAEKVKQLIPAIILPQEAALTMPFVVDTLGVCKALSILIPSLARTRLAATVNTGSRTVAEVAEYVGLPVAYVDFWLRQGDVYEALIRDAHSL